MSAPVRSLSLVTLLALLLAVPARAAIERVRITRASEDEITVQRANGDLWRLALPRECAGLGGTSSPLFIHYAVTFPGPEPRVLVPAYDADCRVTRADSVGHRAPPAPKVD